MAGELQAQHVSGATLYATILNAAGAVWNGAAFDASPTSGEWATYDVAMTEDGVTGYYRGNLPAVGTGLFRIRIHKQLGGAPASTDPVIWTDEHDTSGAATDPMTNAASGYASGSLGAIISRLTAARVTVSSFLSEAGDMLEVVAGADYSATDGTAFDWTQDTGAWPDLTGATVVWHGRSRTGTAQTYSMSVTDATGATKAVRLELTSAQTTALAAVATGVWTFAVWATLSGGRKARLVNGTATVVDGPGPS